MPRKFPTVHVPPLFDIRPEEMSSVLRNSLLAACISSLNAIALGLGILGRVESDVVLIWLIASLALFGLIALRSLRARNYKPKHVSLRGIRRIVIFALLSASPWAVLPHITMGASDGTVEVIVLTVCAGMSSGAAFMMHRVPLAAYTYFCLVLFSVVFSCIIHDFYLRWPIVVCTLAFGGFLFLVTGSVWRVAREREYNLRQATTALERLAEANKKLDRLKSAAEHDALHDPLTSLGNRRGLSREFRERAAALRSPDEGLAVLHVDLDRFKEINDTLGHETGDQVLVYVASLLRRESNIGDYVARIGGDEFVILTQCGPDKSALADLGERIIARISQPIAHKGNTCSFGASIGIDLGMVSESCRTLDAERILANADIALYSAKNRGRGRLEFFCETLRDAFEQRKLLSDELLLAVQRREFVPFFQPQIDASTGKICGVEALARWQHPQRGLLTPNIFLPIAERLGVTATIDRLILSRALEILKGWSEKGVHIPRLAVNVSADRLQEPGLLHEVLALNIAPGQIAFEVLESTFADNVTDELRRTLDRLKEIGVDIEIDDFGTGHTSLLGLLSVRPQRLKIAGELAAHAATSALHRDLVRAVINIASALNVEVTAEGVETQEQADSLADVGCHYLQGYYFGRPMTEYAFLDRILSEKRDAPSIAYG